MVGINLLWGGSAVSARYALDVFGPFTLAALRFLPAGLLLFLVMPGEMRRTRILPQDRLPLVMLGLIGVGVTYSVFYYGLRSTTAIDASLLFACEPILIALVAGIWLHERLTLRQWGGMLLGLAGIWLIAGRAAGNWIALLGLCCESATSVLAKRLANRYPGLLVVAYEMLIGALLLLPFAAAEAARKPIHGSVAGVAGLIYLSLICSALCYGIWYHSLSRYPVSVMGAFILIQPLMGPLYGWLLRGEEMKPGSLIGALLVLLGVTLTTLIGRSKAVVPRLGSAAD